MLGPKSAALAVLAGRLLLCPIFVIEAIGYVTSWRRSAAALGDRLTPMIGKILGEKIDMAAHLLLAGAVAFLVLGSLCVALGLWARVGAVLLSAILIPGTLLFHTFWTQLFASDRAAQMAIFFKNAGLLGGLLLLIAFGPGPISLGRICCRSGKGA